MATNPFTQIDQSIEVSSVCRIPGKGNQADTCALGVSRDSDGNIVFLANLLPHGQNWQAVTDQDLIDHPGPVQYPNPVPILTVDSTTLGNMLTAILTLMGWGGV